MAEIKKKTEQVEEVAVEENKVPVDITKLTEQEKVTRLYNKILSVMKIIGGVEMDGYNESSKYKYISSENMMAKLRAVLPTVGLIISPTMRDMTEQHFTDGRGRIIIRTTISMDFELIDTETGYREIRHWIGADQDYGGKSGGQAATEACKRFYFKTFFVSSKDDADPDGKTIEIGGGKFTPNAQKNESKTTAEPYSRTKGGFLKFALDSGYAKEETPTLAKMCFGDIVTNEKINAWVSEHGWDSKYLFGKREQVLGIMTLQRGVQETAKKTAEEEEEVPFD